MAICRRAYAAKQPVRGEFVPYERCEADPLVPAASGSVEGALVGERATSCFPQIITGDGIHHPATELHFRVADITADNGRKWSLTPEQARQLIVTSEHHPLGITVQLGLYLGLRPGEVLGLQWSDIDVEERTLTVRRSLKRENNQLRFGPPKTLGSIRTLKMSAPLSIVLIRHRSEQERQKAEAGELWHDLDLVVATEIGTPVDPSNSRRALNEFCETAGIGHWSPNELRHSFASLMSLSGAPMEEVADAMGHVDTRMTSQVYRHNLKSVVDVAESRLDAMLTNQHHICAEDEPISITPAHRPPTVSHPD